MELRNVELLTIAISPVWFLQHLNIAELEKVFQDVSLKSKSFTHTHTGCVFLTPFPTCPSATILQSVQKLV